MKTCSRCNGNDIKDNAVKCPYCGYSFDGSGDSDPQGSDKDNSDKQKIKGRKTDSRATEDKPSDYLLNQRKKRKKSFLVIIAIIIVILLVYFLIHNGEKNNRGSIPVTPDTDTEQNVNTVENAEKEDVMISSGFCDVSEYPTVKLYLNVTDKNGGYVDLNNPVVNVGEVNGNTQLSRAVNNIEKIKGKQGIAIELIADNSASMEYDLAAVQNMMTQFVDSLDYNSGDKAELIVFESDIMYMCNMTNDSDYLKTGIGSMVAMGETALYDALYEGINSVGNTSSSRCVIAFTDGDDNCSVHTASEVGELAKKMNVPVFIIGVGDVNESNLSNIAALSNGKYININNVDVLVDLLSEIYTNQKDMYMLEYVSNESEFDRYDARNVDVTIEDDRYYGGNVVSAAPVKISEPIKHDKRYEIVKANVSWTEADANARRMGGHLATITSASEMNKLTAMAEDVGLYYIWIGGYTSMRNGTAFGHWVTGEPFTYSAWCKNQPSGYDDDGTPEKYIMLWNIEHLGGWSWNDQRNDPATVAGGFKGKMGYIVEYEDVQ